MKSVRRIIGMLAMALMGAVSTAAPAWATTDTGQRAVVQVESKTYNMAPAPQPIAIRAEAPGLGVALEAVSGPKAARMPVASPVALSLSVARAPAVHMDPGRSANT